MLIGLLSREVSISSILACEDVTSGGAEISAFGGGDMSAPAAVSSQWQSVPAHSCNYPPCLS